MEKETKQCSRCKGVKEFALFSKSSSRIYPFLRSQCKKCDADDVKRNKARHTASINANYQKNKERILAYKAQYKKDNPEKRRAIQYNSWVKHKGKYLEQHNLRMATDEFYAFKDRLRKSIRNAIKNGYPENGRVGRILGCSHDDFIKYIEQQFKEGMNWKNIHLDHIEPLSRALTKHEFITLCHYTNVQPLFPEDNLSKGNKFDETKTRLKR